LTLWYHQNELVGVQTVQLISQAKAMGFEGASKVNSDCICRLIPVSQETVFTGEELLSPHFAHHTCHILLTWYIKETLLQPWTASLCPAACQLFVTWNKAGLRGEVSTTEWFRAFICLHHPDPLP